jgi:MoaA/NifB/PqqE/SkfB family radical SAM enzyme
MKLEDIGFYTLSDDRAKQASASSPLWRCELLLTSKCNFKCPYCRGTKKDADISFEDAENVVDIWADYGVKNVRFSGGEPTIVDWLPDLVKHASSKDSIEHIAISTNGTKDLEYYENLVSLGVNDFSISLDACCSSHADEMAGKKGYFEIITRNIKELSKISYVTVGCVFNGQNIESFLDTVNFAESLGVSDIRIISAAQYNEAIQAIKRIPQRLIEKYPILRYRYKNFLKGRNVRGLRPCDSSKCRLLLDDMAVRGEMHYPCIIKMREGCEPIGSIYNSSRLDRLDYYKKLNTHKDPICSKNCLDVCIDYNNKAEELKGDRT